MRWDLVETVETFRDEVIDAWANTSGASLFYRSSFLKQYQRAPVTDLESAGAMVRVDGNGVDALVPLFVRRGANPFAVGEPSRAELITPMPHCYDAHIDLAWLRDPEFVAGLRSTAQACGCERVVVESLTMLDSCPESPPTPKIELVEGAPRYVLEPIPTEEAYAARLSRATRRSMRRHARLAHEAGTVDHLARAADAPLDAVIGLCLDTAARKAPGYYAAGPLRKLIEATHEHARVLWIEIDGRVVGGTICFFDRDAVHFWAGGVAPSEGEKWSWNHVLFAAELRTAFDSGARRAEFGRRGDDFKRRHRLHRHPMYRVTYAVGGTP